MDYLVIHLINNIISGRIMPVCFRYYCLRIRWRFGKCG